MSQLIGIVVFTIISISLFWYASGKWNIPADQKERYTNWVNKHGAVTKKSVIVVAIIYYGLMIVQIMQ